MSSYSVTGHIQTAGEIAVSGSKNAVLPMIASTLYFESATLHNVPDILDVHLMIEILESLGSVVTFAKGEFAIDNRHLSLEHIRKDLFKKARATYYIIPPLLVKFGQIELAYPGGCSIGKRPIEGITSGLVKFGFTHSVTEEMLSFTGKNNNESVVVNANFSVGTTLVMLFAALTRDTSTRIECSAFEPHVRNIIDILRGAGASIGLRFDHTIIVKPSKLASHLEGTVIADYIVSGTFAIIGALTAKDYIDIHHARIEDLSAFLYSMQKMGVRYDALDGDILRVYRAKELTATTIQTNIFPGFPTDLQSPMAILMTQAEGMSRIHEIMFEGRLNWLVELENMHGHVAILNPHEALIFGKTPLQSAKVSSWDLRSGAAMLIAGMIAEGTTEITNVSHIERGYECFVERLQAIGAGIKKC